MIEFYTWSTSNGRKVAIALEEMGLSYNVRPVDIYNGEQFNPEFTAISPNSKIPAIVDHDTGVKLFESGAILIYLAEMTGRFLARSGTARATTLQWLMWQMSGFGPILGQAAHFLTYKPGMSDYSADRFSAETRRLYAVLDHQLAQTEFVAGEYSIADMAIWPWTTRFQHQKIETRNYPNIARWYKTVASRPAVLRGYKIPDPNEAYPPFRAEGVEA